jgi:hypothetical protein
MKGKGTGEPGEGTHAVFCWLIIYPAGHSKSFGMQPLPASLTVKPVGHIKPTRIHCLVELFGSYFSGQYYTQVVLYR